MNKKLCILLGFEKGVGKDTFCDAVISAGHTVTRLKFATLLKDRVSAMFNLNRELLDTSDDYKNNTVLYFGTVKTVREVLQLEGDRMKQEEGEDVFALHTLTEALMCPVSIITDFRFLVEYDTLAKHRDLYVVPVRIINNRVMKDKVELNYAINSWQGWEYYLHNNGSLTEFKSDAVKMYNAIYRDFIKHS